jgi:hypothetical protein
MEVVRSDCRTEFVVIELTNGGALINAVAEILLRIAWFDMTPQCASPRHDRDGDWR